MTSPQTATVKRLISIDWLDDDHECDTCGWGFAEGARVLIDGEEALLLEPHAYCFDSDNWDFPAVMALIIFELGGYVVRDENALANEVDPAGKLHITLESEVLRDDDTNSHGQSMRAVIDGIFLTQPVPGMEVEDRLHYAKGKSLVRTPETPILHWPTEALGEDSPYHTESEALVKIATYLGAVFTPGSIPSWVTAK